MNTGMMIVLCVSRLILFSVSFKKGVYFLRNNVPFYTNQICN